MPDLYPTEKPVSSYAYTPWSLIANKAHRPGCLLFLIIFFLSQSVFAQPTISSFTPTSGAIGTTVTITGTNFSATPANNIVYFGAVKATVSAATATSLTVTVPAGASYQPVTVTTNHLTAASIQSFAVTFAGGGATFTPSSFGAAITKATSAYPTAVLIGDLDVDGKPDVITININSGSISVFKNKSTGNIPSFASNIDYPAGDDPISGYLADLDGDGLLDLITVNNSGNGSFISLFRNTSSGSTISFATRLDISTGTTQYSSPAEAIATDLDGDGKPDLAIMNSGALTIYHNKSAPGSLSFDGKQNYTINVGNGSIAAGDMDGDGKTDIIVTSTNPSTISLFRNTSTSGSIVFGSRTDYNSGNSPFGITVADLDGDGKLDFAVGNADDNTLVLFKNSSTPGTMSFADTVTYPTGPYAPKFIAVGDLDGDGKPDLAVANTNPKYIGSTPTYFVLGFKNTSTPGSMIFASPQSYQTGNGLPGVSVGDVTGDGMPDIVVPACYDNTFNILANQVPAPHISAFTPLEGGTGSIMTITGTNFTGATAVSIGGKPATNFTVNSPTSITATVPQCLAGNVTVTSAYGTGSLPGWSFTTLPIVNSYTPASGPIGTAVTIRGANFDATAANNTVFMGAVKVPVASATKNTLTVNVPGGTSYQPLTVQANGVTAFPMQPFVLTFPGGGIVDSTSFAVKTDYPVAYSPVAFTASDLDGDGQPDLIVATGGTGVAVYRNTGSSGTLTFAAPANYTTGSSPTYIITGDLDKDGKPDVIVANLIGNTISILRNTSTPGNISFAAKVDVSAYGYPAGIAIGDLDGDGLPDLAITHENANGIVSIYPNTSTPGHISFGSEIDMSTDSNPTNLVIGDLDGDGIPDIAVANSGYPHTMTVFRNTSSYGMISFEGPFSYPTPWGPNYIAMGDLDGDGKADLATANGSSASVFRNTSTPGALSFTRTDLVSNSGASAVAIGDLDGDGKADLALTSDIGKVSVLKNYSSSGNISFASKVDYISGTSVARLFIGDLHGDGKNDLVAANAGSNTISVFRYQPSVRPPIDIRAFTPAQAAAGTTVTISGAYLTGATAVSFGGTPAQSFTVLSDTSITAIAGTGASGSVFVSGSNGIDSLAGFTFIDTTTKTPPDTTTTPPADTTTTQPPAGHSILSSFTPAQAGTGDTVQILGHYLSTIQSVSFGGTPAHSFTVLSDSTVIAIVGTGATGQVLISGPNGLDSLQGFIFRDTTTTPPVTPPDTTVTPPVLPVFQLVQFTGVSLADQPSLQWHTLYDRSISYYVIEQSTDSTHFGAVSSITALGKDSAAYSFTDPAPRTGINYYRLKIEDTAGHFIYSNIVAIQLAGTPTTLSVYPNPATGSITVSPPNVLAPSQFTLADMVGNVVKTIPVQKNVPQVTIDLTGLVNGVYKLIWSDGSSYSFQTILIRRN